MQRRFEETGVAGMLERGQIAFLFLSHEHLDRLWGLRAVLRHRPDITLRIPAGFSETASGPAQP
ncbi:MAG: metal-dependent hydrolase beta-lactamase superfamily II [Rhodospirillaceae bacterium]|nr:MAG: metal-dependent hydrolase beta-lactamase superfamily II [Rhodospirillaceae bacterium]